MQKLQFTKMIGSGNDFVLIGEQKFSFGAGGSYQATKRLSFLAKTMCRPKFGVGADGLLLVEKDRKATVKMRIFNADGSEAEMCGNGARCVAWWANAKYGKKPFGTVSIATNAGIIACQVKGDSVKIKLTDPSEILMDIPLRLQGRIIRGNFVNTGVPHTVIFSEGLGGIDVVSLGRLIRFHKRFTPRGTNVDFVEALSKDSIRIRTYERGVENETLACGTGSAAAALIFSLKVPYLLNKVNVHTQSKEVLSVYFKRDTQGLRDVWLEGKVKKTYEGVYYV
jgi:diaminopimelate epimerase